MITSPLLHFLLIQLAFSKHEDLDSPVLFAAIKNGDHQAFRKFFEGHHKQLYHFLLKRGTPEQAAEDLVQQAFVMIWEKREQIDEHKSLRAYLFQIAYSRMLNYFRDHKKFDDGAEASKPENFTPEDELQNTELNQQIESAINSMPEKRQMVFRLCFLQDFSYKEAAQALEVSIKTIENHMGLALKDLRKALEHLR